MGNMSNIWAIRTNRSIRTASAIKAIGKARKIRAKPENKGNLGNQPEAL